MMKWTKDYDKKDTVLNVMLSKTLGFYQMLDPSAAKAFGRHYVLHAVAAALVAYEAAVLAVCAAGVCRWIAGNITHVVLQLTVLSNFSFACYKMWLIVRHAAAMRACAETGCRDLLRSAPATAGTDSRATAADSGFRRYRWRSLAATNAYAYVCAAIVLVYSVSPLLVPGSSLCMTLVGNGSTADAGHVHYRGGPYNVFFAVPSDTYNRHYGAFYALEVLFGLVYYVCAQQFDTFLVSMCMAVSFQLDTVGRAYVAFGRRHTDLSEMKNPNIKLETINNLKMIITDHQTVLKKMEDFFSIIQFVVLSQLLVAALTSVFMLFTILMIFYSGNVDDSRILNICSGFPFFVFQLYLICYIFQSINDEKDAISFAIYSSNWEDMDIECKKLILLALRMNSGHNLCMKITKTKVVNLEMFSQVIRMCYTLLSVMVNSNIKASK